MPYVYICLFKHTSKSACIDFLIGFTFIFFLLAQQPNAGQDRLIIEVTR